MKTVIVLGDGMADRPVASLGGRTPLAAAVKPHIDLVARRGRCGLFETIPPGAGLGSDIANLGVLGYDAARVSQGRAVLEAASMGVELADGDVALRLNLIAGAAGRIKNHSAGHISSEEAAAIVRDLDDALGGGRGDQPLRIHPGVSYRHLLVLEGGWASPEVTCFPPHDNLGAEIAALLPRAPGAAGVATAARLVALIDAARPILAAHPVNRARAAAGRDEASEVWPWSPGRRPRMDTLQQRFGVSGAVISAVDLVFGLGRYAGMEMIHVPGATGLWDTNYEGKAAAALDALARHDLVYLHVEAIDEAGHARDAALKVRCIEDLDRRVVKPLLDGLAARGLDATVAVLPDHPTPVETGNHVADPVPVAIWTPGVAPDAVTGYDEVQCAAGSLGTLRGDEFIRLALGR